jgi:hypothetical protein
MSYLQIETSTAIASIVQVSTPQVFCFENHFGGGCYGMTTWFTTVQFIEIRR